MKTRTNAGSAMLVVLTVFAVLATGASVVLSKLSRQYQDIVQAQSWQEAMHATEAGIDLALGTLREQVRNPDSAWAGWSGSELERVYPSLVLRHGGEGNATLRTTVVVDAPPELIVGDYQYYRVRSYGTASLPGLGRAPSEKVDARLRRFSLRADRLTGKELPRPQVTRAVEVIARPVAAFDVAILGDKAVAMNNHNIEVDSFDSTDVAKSTNGQYSVAKRQTNGDVATNGPLVEAGNAHIYGDVMTNQGQVTGTANVTGEIRDDYYRDLIPMEAPVWTIFNQTPASVSDSTALQAGPIHSPSRYKLSSISLTGNAVLELQPPSGGGPGRVEIWVTGNINTAGNGEIRVHPGVQATVWFEGNVDITGNGVVNQEGLAKNFVLYGITKPQTPNRYVKLAGNGAYIGGVYAPEHDIELKGGGNSNIDTVYGALVGRTVTMKGHTEVHYDEALSNQGEITDYVIASWFEDWRGNLVAAALDAESTGEGEVPTNPLPESSPIPTIPPEITPVPTPAATATPTPMASATPTATPQPTVPAVCRHGKKWPHCGKL